MEAFEEHGTVGRKDISTISLRLGSANSSTGMLRRRSEGTLCFILNLFESFDLCTATKVRGLEAN